MRALKELIGLYRHRRAYSKMVDASAVWLGLTEEDRERCLAWIALLKSAEGTGKLPMITFWSMPQVAALSVGDLKFDNPVEGFSVELDEHGLPHLKFNETYDRLANKHWQAVLLASYDLLEAVRDCVLDDLPQPILSAAHKFERAIEKHAK